MTVDYFLDKCELLWPGPKVLTLDQRAFYGAKLLPFEPHDLEKIFDYLSENSRFFPKIADVFDAARHCQMLDRVQPSRPHEWTPTDCRHCGGSGSLAVFFEESCDKATGHRDRQLRRVMQYESSNTTYHTTDWVRFYFRCSCSEGEAPTLNHGLPQWRSA